MEHHFHSLANGADENKVEALKITHSKLGAWGFPNKHATGITLALLAH